MTGQQDHVFQVSDRVYDPAEGRTAIVSDIERRFGRVVYVLRPDLPHPGSDFWVWRRTADEIAPAAEIHTPARPATD